MNGANIFAIAGLLSALIGSIDMHCAVWSARVMLAGNLATLGLSLRERVQRRNKLRAIRDERIRRVKYKEMMFGKPSQVPGPYSGT